MQVHYLEFEVAESEKIEEEVQGPRRGNVFFRTVWQLPREDRKWMRIKKCVFGDHKYRLSDAHSLLPN